MGREVKTRTGGPALTKQNIPERNHRDSYNRGTSRKVSEMKAMREMNKAQSPVKTGGLLTKTKSSPLNTLSPTRLFPKLLERGRRKIKTTNDLSLLVTEMKVEDDGVIFWKFAETTFQ